MKDSRIEVLPAVVCTFGSLSRASRPASRPSTVCNANLCQCTIRLSTSSRTLLGATLAWPRVGDGFSLSIPGPGEQPRIRGNVQKSIPMGTLGRLGSSYPEPNLNLSIGFGARRWTTILRNQKLIRSFVPSQFPFFSCVHVRIAFSSVLDHCG